MEYEAKNIVFESRTKEINVCITLHLIGRHFKAAVVPV